MVNQPSRVQPRDQESGQILVLTAVSMTVLLGVAALTLDASFMYAKRNRLHAAADAAAKSAAIENLRYSSITQAGLNAFADQQVGAHGFVSTRLGGTTNVVVNRPPASGPFAGQAGYVEAVVSEPTGTFFGKLLGWTSMTPGATAVAGGGPPTSCMVVTENLTIGNSTLTLNGCGVDVGGILHGGNPNATITGTPLPSVGVTGTCTGRCGGMGSLTTGAPTPVDPLAGLPLPANPGGCKAGKSATLGPGCYTSMSTAVKTLTAGIYYIT
jgi:Flp pilus assembly protein TadG